MKRFRPAVLPFAGLIAVSLAILFLLAPVVAQPTVPVGAVDQVQAESG